jgi:ABC-type antimicrobial peptide transport system permease subunit
MRRRHELAVRLAFGADDRGVVGLVLREGAVLVAVGLLVGVPGVYAASWLLRGMLIDVSPFDPLTLVLVSAGLTIVALAACYVPARRAAMADPATLLRQG